MELVAFKNDVGFVVEKNKINVKNTNILFISHYRDLSNTLGIHRIDKTIRSIRDNITTGFPIFMLICPDYVINEWSSFSLEMNNLF